MRNTMKNKKGFTVVELLAVVVVIAIIALIAFASVYSIMQKAREKQYETNMDSMGSAARLFSDDAKNGLSKVNNALVYKDSAGKTWKIGCKRDENTNKRMCCVSMSLLRDIGYLKVTEQDMCADHKKCNDYYANITYLGNTVDVELLYGTESCEVIKYAVVYHSVVKIHSGEEETVTRECEYNKECELLTTPSEFKLRYPGHTVVKWEDRRGELYDPGKGKDFTNKMVSDIVELFANWKNNEFTFKYNANTGTGSMSDSHHTYEDGSTLSPNAFSKVGYTYQRWNDKADGTGREYQNRESVSLNTFEDGTVITLYAIWKANPYAVSFDANGGKNLSVDGKTVTFDSPYGQLATVEREGYDFQGWWTAQTGGSQVTASTIVKTPNNHTLYAHWKAKNYTVTFDKNTGNNPSPASKTVTYDQKYGTLASISKEGYDFQGWYTAKDGGTEVTQNTIVKITADQTLYAHWKAKNYTVTFDKNGGNNPSPTSKTVTFDSAYGDLATVSRTGYDFTGWYKATGGNDKVEKTTIVKTASNHSIYAHWNAKKYTITYSTNSCGSTTGTTKEVTYDSAYGTLAGFTAKTGYDFSGWYTAASGGTKIEATTTVKTASNHTLYAHCSPKTFTVTFNKNGGGNPSPASKTVTYDSTYGSLATSSWTGYKLLGWYTAASGGTKIETTTTVKITANQILYAHWKYRCDSGWTFSSSDNKCHYSYAATKGCPSGYSASGDKCRKSSTYSAYATGYSGGCSWSADSGHMSPSNNQAGCIYKSELPDCGASNIGAQRKVHDCGAGKHGKINAAHTGYSCSNNNGDRYTYKLYTCGCSGSVVYGCNSGDSKSGSTCTHYDYTNYVYSCPNGGTLSGTTCNKTANPSN